MTTREYSKNLFAKWIDDDWLDQPRFDKLFWEALNGQRNVNTAGIFPLNFTRWRKAMRDGPTLATDAELKAALIRMAVINLMASENGAPWWGRQCLGNSQSRSRLRSLRAWLSPLLRASAPGPHSPT